MSKDLYTSDELTGFEYRKKPVVIQAVQWLGHNQVEYKAVPEWYVAAEVAGVIRYNGDLLVVATLEGDMMAPVGHWIIQGIQGELYPCKPDIFEASYEKVGEV